MDMQKLLSCLSACHEPKIVGAALHNNGNSCFINAVLQCLVHNVPLIQKLRASDHYATCPGSTDDFFCSLCALKNHIDMSLYMSGYVIAARRFSLNLNRISTCFEDGQQEDAHEFLQGLLDNIDRTCRGRQQPLNSSIVQQIFGGRLRSQVRCCECNHLSDTFEPFLGLSLEINNMISLEDALSSFTAVEKIDDAETKLTCGGCNAKVLVEKQIKVDHAPQVLALHLKRFKSDGCYVQKLYHYVDYAMILDFTPYLSFPEVEEEDMEYELFAVIVHVGEPENGHYYSLISPSRNYWVKMDDTKINRVSMSCAEKQIAYMLFYIKKDSAPPFWATIMRNMSTLADSLISENTARETRRSMVTTNSETVAEIVDGPDSNPFKIGLHSPNGVRERGGCIGRQRKLMSRGLPQQQPLPVPRPLLLSENKRHRPLNGFPPSPFVCPVNHSQNMNPDMMQHNDNNIFAPSESPAVDPKCETSTDNNIFAPSESPAVDPKCETSTDNNIFAPSESPAVDSKCETSIAVTDQPHESLTTFSVQPVSSETDAAHQVQEQKRI